MAEVRPLWCSRLMWVGWCEGGQVRRCGRHRWEIVEPLRTSHGPDARPSWYGDGITFYSADGNTNLGTLRGFHRLDVDTALCLTKGGGTWVHITAGELRHMPEVGWVIVWHASSNTRVVDMLNMGFPAYHRPELAFGPWRLLRSALYKRWCSVRWWWARKRAA